MIALCRTQRNPRAHKRLDQPMNAPALVPWPPPCGASPMQCHLRPQTLWPLWAAVALTMWSPSTQAQPIDISVCTATRIYNNPDPHPPQRCAVKNIPGPEHIPECATLDHFGSSIAVGGDFNGDGEADVVIGGNSDTGIDGQSTQAWLFLGPENTPALTMDGDGHTDLFGAALCFVPDLNGDGRDELAIGAPAAGTTGRVFLFFGSALDESAETARRPALSSADVILQGSRDHGRFGASLASGDIDGDGRADLIVGAPGCRASDTAGFAGSVALFSGVDLAGATSAALGSDDATAELSPSPRLLLSSKAQRQWTGLLPGDRFGYCLTVAGDLDGERGAEVLAGAPQVDPTDLQRQRAATGSGYCWALSSQSSAPLLQFGPLDNDNLPLQFGEGFGAAVAGDRDLNGDGVPDLVVGAPLFKAITAVNDVLTAGQDNGRVWFFSGADGRPFFANTAPASAHGQGSPRLVSNDPTAQLGWSLAFVDDATGDSFCDLIVGARGESSEPTACPWNRKLPVGDAVAGAVHVIDGRTGESVTRITGLATLDLLGQAIAAYDMDGDGLAEIFCSAASWAPKGSPPSRQEQGQAYMMQGSHIAKR